jgi:hypothetical protein
MHELFSYRVVVGFHCFREAWNSLGKMSKQEAMKQYVNVLSRLVPEWREQMNRDSHQSLRGFRGPVFSRPIQTDDSDTYFISPFF